eukprot:145081_1
MKYKSMLLFEDEFEVQIDVLDFYFDGRKQVAFHLNIGRHMEVTKVKSVGHVQELGVIQGDILLRINEDDVSKNWEKAIGLLRNYVASKEQFTITFVRRKVESLIITVVRADNAQCMFKTRIWMIRNCLPMRNKNCAKDAIIQVYSNPESSEALWVIKNVMTLRRMRQTLGSIHKKIVFQCLLIDVI